MSAQAPRQKNKGTKIAYNILGKPSNLTSRQTRKQKKRDAVITYQDTDRSK
jgi:hypothetical protein